jgi:hypothetical protein
MPQVPYDRKWWKNNASQKKKHKPKHQEKLTYDERNIRSSHFSAFLQISPFLERDFL